MEVNSKELAKKIHSGYLWGRVKFIERALTLQTLSMYNFDTTKFLFKR